jgi:hypothetical protein
MPPLSQWESFYVIVGSSAAALTGLQFVVVALSSGVRIKAAAPAAMEAFASPTVVHFCAVLLVAAIVATPGHTLGSLSWCFGMAGLAGLVYTIATVIRSRRQTDYIPVLEDWICHAILPILAYGSLLAAGLFFRTHPAAALYWVAITALILLYVGIHNAWDAALYIAGKSQE